MSEIEKDILEWKQLRLSATRPKVIQVIENSLSSLSSQLAEATKKECKSSITDNKLSNVAVSEILPLIKITTYAWDQSDKFVKLYVTIPGVELSPENVKCDFQLKSFELNAKNINGTDYQLIVKGLLHQINVANSHFKVKKDTVLLMLSKEKAVTHWSCLTEHEQRIKDRKAENLKPTSKEEDPSSGIMSLMKQMYDDGDDDMKRTIKKAWCESQEKKQSGKDELNFNL